jgi:hypothetical protein
MPAMLRRRKHLAIIAAALITTAAIAIPVAKARA